MSTMLRLAARIRHAIFAIEHTTDGLLAALAIAVGIWFCVPGWALRRYPRVAEQMATVCPVWMWGAAFIAIGAAAMFGVLARRPGAIVLCHLIGFGMWMFLGGIMCFRHVPPVIGFVCPVIGVFSAIRLAQLPSD
jgi:hypothetical protein